MTQKNTFRKRFDTRGRAGTSAELVEIRFGQVAPVELALIAVGRCGVDCVSVRVLVAEHFCFGFGRARNIEGRVVFDDHGRLAVAANNVIGFEAPGVAELNAGRCVPDFLGDFRFFEHAAEIVAGKNAGANGFQRGGLLGRGGFVDVCDPVTLRVSDCEVQAIELDGAVVALFDCERVDAPAVMVGRGRFTEIAGARNRTCARFRERARDLPVLPGCAGGGMW